MQASVQAPLAPQTEQRCELLDPAYYFPLSHGVANEQSPMVLVSITASDPVAAPGHPALAMCCRAAAGGVGSLVDGTVRYGTVQYGTVQYGKILKRTVRYGLIPIRFY